MELVKIETAGMPSQVAEQTELLNNYLAGLAQGDGSQALAELEAHEQPGGPAAESPAEPATGAAAPVGEVQPGPGAAAPAAAEPAAAPAFASPQEESAYKVLQGKYNAEVPRLQQQLKEQEAELQRLRTHVPAAQATEQEEPGEDVYSRYRNAMLEGEEDEASLFKKAVAEAAREVIETQIKPFQQNMEVSRDERYVTDLGSLANGWEQTQANPEFSAFLDTPAPFTGVPLRQLLNEADASRDAVRVAEIYNAFKPANSRAHSQPGEGTGRELPAHLISPARTSGGGTIPGAQKTVTAADVEKAAANLGKGLITQARFNEVFTGYHNTLYPKT